MSACIGPQRSGQRLRLAYRGVTRAPQARRPSVSAGNGTVGTRGYAASASSVTVATLSSRQAS